MIMWCVCSVRFSSWGSVSGTLRGSLNSPSLFWLDEGEPGADCSVLSSCCSWKTIGTVVRSCLHDFCGWANKPRKHRSVFPSLLSQEESLGDYVACVASVSVRFRSKAAERGTGFSGLVPFSARLKPKSRSFFAPKPRGNACYAV